MPKTSENNCDCDACRENAIHQHSAKDVAFIEAFLLRNAVKKIEVTEEDKALAKGKEVIINKKLREDILLDKVYAKVARLSPKEILIYSGKARMATRREEMAMRS